MFKSKDGSTKSNDEKISGKEASTSSDPRGGDSEKNTPKPSGDPVTPPSQKRPHNPSDAIEDQIEASDAKTKRPGTEFEKMSDEQVRDYAVAQGIDGNDGLKREDIIAKITAFQGKRMFENDPNGETSAQLADRVHREGPDAVKEDLK